jgi:RNA polymerase sigma-54 factor
VALRSLFQASAAPGADGRPAPARDDVRDLVRAIVAGEDPALPLSDDELARELARRGHAVARRTVAKYRGELDIPSSYRRRRYAQGA